MRTLIVDGTRVTDNVFKHLARLEGLQIVTARDTAVTLEPVRRFEELRPGVAVEFTLPDERSGNSGVSN